MIDPLAWLRADPDPETAAELRTLLEEAEAGVAEAADELAERFGSRLTFGTAGLRGPLGTGSARMNRVVVRQAAAGLIQWLTSSGAVVPARSPTVVIGFDARKNSHVFATDTAALVAAAGGRALLFEGPVPTPVLAFAVRHVGADAGVMVTASHNPPADNGYKVYLADGAQLLPPADTEIEAAIAAIGLHGPELPPPAQGGAIAAVGEELVAAYIAAVSGAVARPAGRPLTVAYTPLHGVGRAVLDRVFVAGGLAAPHVVPEQAEPDGTFPTVSFPNPEEPGAMDLVLALARSTGADLVLANDPDADRLAVAIPVTSDGAGGTEQGSGWRVLTGNETGILLADRILALGSGEDRLVLSSIVSSRQLARLAEQVGVQHRAVLTGFKWIARVGFADPSLRFVFGYEEALGYACTSLVRDKDGISAALAFVELAAALDASGRTVQDRLDELAVLTGLHSTGQVSLRLCSPAEAGAVVAAVRAAAPRAVGPWGVRRCVDHLHGDQGLPPADLLVLELEGDATVLLRPSGTESKLKAYLEVVRPVPAAAAVPAARAASASELETLADAVRSLLAG